MVKGIGPVRRPAVLHGIRVPYDADFSSLRAQLRPAGAAAWAACIALGHNSTEEALALLVALAQDKDWRYRRSAIEAMSTHPLAASAARWIKAALEDGSRHVVSTACRTAAAAGLTALHDDVRDLLHSDDPEIRCEALRALEQMWEAGDFEPVFRVLVSDVAEDVRRQAGWTLRAHASDATWRRLFDVWVGDPLARHRAWACELAGRFGNAAEKRTVAHLCEDRDGHVRAVARRVVGAGAATST